MDISYHDKHSLIEQTEAGLGSIMDYLVANIIT